MIRIYIVVVFALALCAGACTKDEQTYRKLDGTYNVASIDIQHYNFCKKVNGNQYRKDSTKVYYENAGEVSFSKKKSTTGNYRSGKFNIISPAYIVGVDTIILKDSTTFLYYVDQLPQSDQQKIGLMDDENLRFKPIYRSTLIAKKQKDINTLEFTYKMIPIRLKAVGSATDLNAGSCEYINCKIVLTKK